nr:hypothetical protein [Tanacetum cinerariifolium]
MSNILHNAIMEAGSKDRPPMLAPRNYIQWKSRIKRYIDTKPNHELIHFCLTNPPYELGWKEKFVLDSEGNPTTATQKIRETYKTVMQEIRDQLNAEAEAVQIILTGIDNDIYSTVDACPNACEMWKAIERLKQVQRDKSSSECSVSTSTSTRMAKVLQNDERAHKESVQSDKSSSECSISTSTSTRIAKICDTCEAKSRAEECLISQLYDILKQHQHEVNEIQVEKIAHVANPLALVAQQQLVYHPQTHPTHYNQNSSTRTQQATRNRG